MLASAAWNRYKYRVLNRALAFGLSMASRATAQVGRQGRPPRISREAIAEAALALGLDSVTLTAVAAHLGVDHSSLYRHIKDRRDMLLAAADLAIGTLQWRTRTTNWRRYVEKTAEAVWSLYERYPGLAKAIRDLDETPAAGVRAFAETVSRLETMGFARPDAVLLLDSIMDMTVDAAVGWAKLHSAAGAPTGETMIRSWTRVAGGHPDMESPIATMESVMRGPPHQWWRRKLELLLDGAAAMPRRPAKA